jgi:hypothetical protein
MGRGSYETKAHYLIPGFDIGIGVIWCLAFKRFNYWDISHETGYLKELAFLRSYNYIFARAYLLDELHGLQYNVHRHQISDIN